MPCHVDPPSYNELASKNKKKFGIYASDEEMYKSIACEAMRLIEKLGHDGEMSKHATAWYEHHKKEDARRLAEEAAERKRRKEKDEAEFERLRKKLGK